MLTVASEVEKLVLYAGALSRNTVEVADVETMVPAAKQRSLYELTDAISLKDTPRALALLGGLLNASEGGEDAAIGHVFSLARTYRQMLVLNEKQVKDQRAMWQVLWPGFRVAPFAADALIAQARRFRDRADLTRGLGLIAKADLELRSSPADKRLVLERLVMRLSAKARESALVET
jgi:DNA polymerase-3 subunit delta